MFRRSILVALLCAGAVHAQDIGRIRADIKHLASDRLEGRGIGTTGESLATEYIADQFAKAGLKPAGAKGGFYQPVPLLKITTLPKSTLAILTENKPIDFQLEEDFVVHSRTQQPAEDFEGEAVFLGHGITAPEYNWADYAGIDVKDKVVIVFTNEPPSDDPAFFKGKSLTYYGRWTYKYEEATRRGAKAVFIIHTNETAGYPYSVVKTLEDAQIERKPGAPALVGAGWLSRRAGERLLQHAGKSVEQALKEADTKGFKGYSLGFRMKGHVESSIKKIITNNVVGIVEGTDPELKKEAVIFTAHWDHLGVRPGALGQDAIYNGAADNGTGCGILLEMARLWAKNVKSKRSALFLATTAEENGLLGAVYYAQNPIIPLGKTALNVNFDTVAPLGVPESLVLNGAERTTLWPQIQKLAGKHGMELEADRRGHLGLFYRSDHFALARGGVPAFSVFPGDKVQGKPADYAQKVSEEYIAKRYHTPADEFQEDWDFTGYPRMMRFALDLAEETANAPTLPTWNAGDEFLPARQKSWK